MTKMHEYKVCKVIILRTLIEQLNSGHSKTTTHLSLFVQHYDITTCIASKYIAPQAQTSSLTLQDTIYLGIHN